MKPPYGTAHPTLKSAPGRKDLGRRRCRLALILEDIARRHGSSVAAGVGPWLVRKSITLEPESCPHPQERQPEDERRHQRGPAAAPVVSLRTRHRTRPAWSCPLIAGRRPTRAPQASAWRNSCVRSSAAFARGALYPLRPALTAEQFKQLHDRLGQMEKDVFQELTRLRSEHRGDES